MKISRLIIYGVLTLIIISLISPLAVYIYILHKPLYHGKKPLIFDIPPSTTAYDLVHKMEAMKLNFNQSWMRFYFRLHRLDSKIKAGDYTIKNDQTLINFIHKIIKGDADIHKLTIIEGWTFADLMEVINENPSLSHTLQDQSPEAIMRALGHVNQNPEGRFFPTTYLFKKYTKDTVIMKQAYDLMAEELQKNWQSRRHDLPYKNTYSVLIVASMIEKEAKLPLEKFLIAGVILRRLQKGMRLQIDPVVIYGLGMRYQGKLTAEDLRVDTPYNIYLRKGLPPTPICMPSSTSIYAALHPDDGNALYFVARGDGSHVFSATLGEHERAVKNYRIDSAYQPMDIFKTLVSPAMNLVE